MDTAQRPDRWRNSWWVGTTYAVLATLAAALLITVAPPAAAAVVVSPVPSPAWQLNGTTGAVLVVGDTTFVGGSFTEARSPDGVVRQRVNFAAFDTTTGALREDVRADANSVVRDLVSDGTTLWVGGSFTTIGGVSRGRIAALDVRTGAVRTGFQANVNSHVYGLDLRAGRLFLGGSFGNVRGVARTRAAAVDPETGVVDPQWAPAPDNTVQSVRANPDGSRVYLSGNFRNVGGVPRTAVAGVDGVLGQPAGPELVGGLLPTVELDMNDSGSRLFGAVSGVGNNRVIAWNTANGQRAWVHYTDGDVQAVDYHDGTVFFGFHDGFQNDTSLRLLAVDATTGVIDQGFTPAFDRYWGVFGISATDDLVAVAGDFTRVSGVAAQGVVFFRADPTRPSARTLVSASASWRYRYQTGAWPTAWQSLNFDDSGWASGPAMLGWGSAGISTQLTAPGGTSDRPVSAIFRHAFDLANVGDLDSVTITTHADDGVALYVNGTEVGRANVPTGPLSSGTYATAAPSTQAATMNPVTFSVPTSLLHNGRNVIAGSMHLNYRATPDASFAVRMNAVAGDGTQPPPQPPPAPEVTAAVDGTSVRLSWQHQPDSSVGSYHVARDGTNIASVTAPGSDYVDHGLEAGRTYEYTVVADAGGGLVSAPGRVTVTIPTSGDPPLGPLLAAGSEWRFRYQTGEWPSDWSSTAYDDTAWQPGRAVLGWGSSQIETNIDIAGPTNERPRSALFRRTVAVTDASQLTAVRLTTRADDGIAVYVNGQEIGRWNLPTGTLTANSNARTAPRTDAAVADPVVLEIPGSVFRDGSNVIAASVHLNWRGTTDVSFDLELVPTPG